MYLHSFPGSHNFYDSVLINCGRWLFIGIILPLHFCLKGKGDTFETPMVNVKNNAWFNICTICVAGLNRYLLPNCNNLFISVK